MPLLRLSDRLAVAYQCDLAAGERALLAYLCYRVDARTGETFTGLDLMARETGISRRVLIERLAALADAGWIVRRRRPNHSSVTVLSPERFNGSAETDTSGSADSAQPEVRKPTTGSAKPARPDVRKTAHYPGLLSGSVSGEYANAMRKQTTVVQVPDDAE